MEPELLDEIKRYLSDIGEEPLEYIACVKLAELTSSGREWIEENFEVDEYLVDGLLYHTKTNPNRKQSPDVFEKLPLTLQSKRFWMGKDSNACMFLTSGNRCLLGDSKTRGKKGVLIDAPHSLTPETCRVFICSTGYLLYALQALHLIDAKDYHGKDMRELNRLANIGLILIHGNILTGNFHELDKKRSRLIRKYVEKPSSKEVKKALAEIQKIYREKMNTSMKTIESSLKVLVLPPTARRPPHA